MTGPSESSGQMDASNCNSIEVYLTTNLSGQYVGVTDRDDDTLVIRYGQLELGTFDMESKNFTPCVRWSGLDDLTRA